MPTAQPKPVHVTDDNKAMLRADLKNETENHTKPPEARAAVRGCEYAMAELICGILVNEQEHQIDLVTALGIDRTS